MFNSNAHESGHAISGAKKPGYWDTHKDKLAGALGDVGQLFNNNPTDFGPPPEQPMNEQPLPPPAPMQMPPIAYQGGAGSMADELRKRQMMMGRPMGY